MGHRSNRDDKSNTQFVGIQMIDMKRFYKYQSLEEYYDKDYNCKNYTLRNLAQNQLYFNDPNNFNDPFDCRIRVDYVGKKEQWIDFLCRKYEFDHKKAEEEVNKFKIGEDGLVYPHNAPSYLKVPRVCCFSDKNNEILMWSHYADSHRGICLCFEGKGNNNKYSMPLYKPKTGQKTVIPGRFKKVDYDRNNDICVMNIFDDQYQNVDIATERVFTKLHIWTYEQEYRMLACDEMKQNNELFEYYKGCLKGIIFGLKINKRDVIRVYNIINKNYLKEEFEVEFFEAKEEIGKYKLKIDKIPDIENHIASLQ